MQRFEIVVLFFHDVGEVRRVLDAEVHVHVRPDAVGKQFDVKRVAFLALEPVPVAVVAAINSTDDIARYLHGFCFLRFVVLSGFYVNVCIGEVDGHGVRPRQAILEAVQQRAHRADAIAETQTVPSLLGRWRDAHLQALRWLAVDGHAFHRHATGQVAANQRHFRGLPTLDERRIHRIDPRAGAQGQSVEVFVTAGLVSKLADADEVLAIGRDGGIGQGIVLVVVPVACKALAGTVEDFHHRSALAVDARRDGTGQHPLPGLGGKAAVVHIRVRRNGAIDGAVEFDLLRLVEVVVRLVGLLHFRFVAHHEHPRVADAQLRDQPDVVVPECRIGRHRHLVLHTGNRAFGFGLGRLLGLRVGLGFRWNDDLGGKAGRGEVQAGAVVQVETAESDFDGTSGLGPERTDDMQARGW